MKKQIMTTLCVSLCATLLLVGCGTKQDEQPIKSSYEVREEATQQIAPEPEPESETEEEPKPEEPEAAKKTIEEDANAEIVNHALVFEADSYVIYDEEGVTVTLDDITIIDNNGLGRTGNFTASITNNNPDNKKASIYLYCLIDGFIPCKFDFGTVNGMSAGETETRTERFSLGYRNDFLNDNSTPVESLAFYYTARIGSESDWTIGHTILKNSLFNKEDFNKIYGERINEFDALDSSFDVYLNENENGILITLKQVGDPDKGHDAYNSYGTGHMECLHFEYQCSINGRFDDRYRNYSDIYEDGGKYLISIGTPENIRSNIEIPNDEPLEITLYLKIFVPDLRNYSEITIPISIPELFIKTSRAILCIA